MSLVIALALFLQVLHGPHAYTVADPETGALQLATQTGTYSMDLGYGCDDLAAGAVVEMLPGSSGVAALVPLGADVACNVYITAKIDDVPCAVNADGACDIPTE